ncbi:MAG: TonB-dependent receptor [Tannerella sp.]|jgi:hypothetical protein|nr:TonB-dependent receptor [Tannerella sp.]
MKIKLVILSVFILIVFFKGYSQEQISISGIIREKSTREVLVNATIQLSGQVAISNERGFFSLKTLRKQQELQVSYTGFKSYKETLNIQKDTTLIIELEEGLELYEVVVTQQQAALRNKGLGNIQIDVTQLRKTPLFLGERDIIKTMQFLPGVSSGMEGSSNLNIRGGTNDQTLYLMDDVPVYNQNHTFGLLSIFNPEILRTADLYKGGIPTMYGNRLSGVAAISLKDGNMHEHRQSLSIGLLAGSLHLEGPAIKNKLSYSLTARRSILDLFARGIMAMRDHSSGMSLFAFHDINAKLVWSLNPKTNISTQFYNGMDDLYAINKDYTSSNSRYKEKFGFGWKTTMTSVRLTSSLLPNLFFSTNIYYTHLNNFQYYQQKNKSSDDKSKLRNDIYSDLEEFGLKMKFEHKTCNQNTLSYGLEATRQSFEPDFMKKTIDKKDIIYKTKTLGLNTVGGYIYNEISWGKWHIGTGLRASLYNNEEKSLFVIEPRVKINRLIGNNKIMIAYDYTSQPIHSINEMNYSAKSDFWVPFRESKLPAAQQLSLGWKNYTYQGLTVSVEGYWKEMKNLLRIDNLENYLDYHTDFSIGKGSSIGLELMIQYEYNRFSTWLSYTLSKSTRTFDNTTHPFKYDTPNDLSLFVSYDIWKKGSIKNYLSMNMQYHTGVPYYVSSVDYPSIGLPSYSSGYPFFNTSQISYIPKNPNTRLPDYFRTDLNFTMEKKLKNKGQRVWQFSLLNMTGHVNPYAVYRNKNGQYKAFLLIPFLPSFSYTRYF